MKNGEILKRGCKGVLPQFAEAHNPREETRKQGKSQIHAGQINTRGMTNTVIPVANFRDAR